MNKKLSVIIAVFNEEKHLKECLGSLKKQTFKDFEVILVDDGSTDGSFARAENLKESLNFKNLKLLKKIHEGPAKARNLGASKAKGEVLVFLDADMYFSPDFLANLVKPILNQKAKGTFSTQELVANWNNVWARCWNYNWNLPDKKRVSETNMDQHKDFRALEKQEFLKVKGFSSTGYTDTWTLGKKLGYQPLATKALYYHYNPASLAEVYQQSRWAAKRDYKFGFWGALLSLFKMSLPVSLFMGIKKGILKQEPLFLTFKLVYDFGASIGLWEKILMGKKYV